MANKFNLGEIREVALQGNLKGKLNFKEPWFLKKVS